MEESKRKYRSVVSYIFIILLAFLGGIMIFNFLIMPTLVGRRDIVIIPDIVGLTEEVAEQRCRESGLNLVTVGERHSDEVPLGYVLEQTPGPDEKLKEGRAIRVIVSAGVRMESVPDLRDESLRQAELLLSSSGLKRGRIVRVFSSEKGETSVFATSPPEGRSAPRDSDVDLLLLVRGEPVVFLMPDLTGKDFPFVRDRLNRLGFHVSRVVSRRVSDKFPNTILSQEPKAGHSIKEGGTIELVVSTVD
jgi:serine/threonine-protein kinase